MSSAITDYFSPKPKRCRMGRCDGDEWSEEEWFQGASQQYVEDRSSPKGDMEEGDEGLQPDDAGMEEFIVDSSFEEWTASFLGREKLGCAKSMVTKEVELRDDEQQPSLGVEVVLNTA